VLTLKLGDPTQVVGLLCGAIALHALHGPSRRLVLLVPLLLLAH
jgi:hypothetical protein